MQWERQGKAENVYKDWKEGSQASGERLNLDISSIAKKK
jgi:hypothetical protein